MATYEIKAILDKNKLNSSLFQKELEKIMFDKITPAIYSLVREIMFINSKLGERYNGSKSLLEFLDTYAGLIPQALFSYLNKNNADLSRSSVRITNHPQGKPAYDQLEISIPLNKKSPQIDQLRKDPMEVLLKEIANLNSTKITEIIQNAAKEFKNKARTNK